MTQRLRIILNKLVRIKKKPKTLTAKRSARTRPRAR
jgi:hypothetical protein